MSKSIFCVLLCEWLPLHEWRKFHHVFTQIDTTLRRVSADSSNKELFPEYNPPLKPQFQTSTHFESSPPPTSLSLMVRIQGKPVPIAISFKKLLKLKLQQN